MVCKANTFSGVNNQNVTWPNWSGRVNFHADQVFAPFGGATALSNLVLVAANATAQGKGLHPIGSGWAFADLAGTDSWTVKVDNFRSALTYVVGQIATQLVPGTVGAGLTDAWRQKQNNANAATQLVHVEAGMEVGDLTDILANLGLALPVLGGANGQSVAGAFTTSTHGGDWDQPPLVDGVRAIHLVSDGGQELWIERASEPVTTDARLAPVLPCQRTQIVRSDAIFEAAMVSLGRFGVIYSLVLEVRRAFRVVEVTTRPSRAAVLQALGTGRGRQDLFQPLFDLLAQTLPPTNLSEFAQIKLATTTPYFFQVVFNSLDPDDLWVQRRWITSDAQDLNLGGPPSGFLIALAQAALTISWAGGAAAAAGVVHTAMDSQLGSAMVQGKRGVHAVMTSGSRAASHNLPYKADSVEVMFPATSPAYIDFLNTILASCRNYHQAGYISVRPSRAGRATLSMHNVSSAHAISIEIASIQNAGNNGNNAWMAYLHQTAVDLGGRPHWGQINTLDDNQMQVLYGQARRNWQVALHRASGMSTVFSNAFTRQRGLEPSPAIPSIGAASAVADDLVAVRIDTAKAEGAAIQTTHWSPSSGGWSAWKALANGIGSAETFVTSCAVGGEAYLFWTGPDAWIYFASRDKQSLNWRNVWVVGRSNEPELNGVPCGAVHAVSSNPTVVHVFYTNRNGFIVSSRGNATGGATWPDTVIVRGGRTAPGGHVTGASRHPGQVDIFTVGTDGQVYTAAWNSAQGWLGWWVIPGVRAKPGTHVSAVSRHQDQLDIFVIDSTGKIMTAAWNPTQAGWLGWWQVQGGVTNSAFVTSISRSDNLLDVFTTDTNHSVITAAWNPAHGWGGWWKVGAAQAKSIVSPVSRSKDKLDLFFVDLAGAAQTAAWEPGRNWGGPWPLV